ncbi:glycosyltransferase family 2 protein [Candidatus Chloroploca asiatica]|uniref:Glycosyltransferase 2-like domain-containing protein n=1 Tax=Candidatus Chloroploca asiatica TaxID=1506545 RepID=A0A2H3KLJ8_9CHLR|nr:glycosyltransferase family 2 protein [Candidatus Chloroploca asiatica]PDV98855.1 hypothetical protein A9Q02_02675 [Candidatus Chloroploca asiatica]
MASPAVPDQLLPLYVVVLNWNLPADTIACLQSLQAAALPEVHLLVVDNGSTDDSLHQIRHHFPDQVELVALPENRGFAGGMNAGIEVALRAGAGSILLLNNDTVVESTMLATLLGAAQQRPQAGILGPAIYYYDAPERLWQIGARQHPRFPVPVNLGLREIRRTGGQPFPADYVTGCAMLVRREVFEHVGLLDPTYVMYFEDADFCQRARKARYEIWCIPAARMWHRVSLSANKVKPASRYTFAWGRGRFYRRYPHGRSPTLTLSYLLLSTAVKAGGDLLRGDWQPALWLWRGMLDGYRLRPLRGPVLGVTHE